MSDDDFLTPDSSSPIQPNAAYEGNEKSKNMMKTSTPTPAVSSSSSLLSMEALLGSKDQLASYFFGKKAVHSPSVMSPSTVRDSGSKSKTMQESMQQRKKKQKHPEEEDDWDIINDDI